MDGPCPGCGTRIVGMMPQRCFYCGHDFTEAIKAQNEGFKPDPGYKSPIGDIQDEVRAAAMAEAEQILGIREEKLTDRYGQPAGEVIDSTAEEVPTDPFQAMAESLNSEMDRQKLIEDAAKKMLDQIASAANVAPSIDGLASAIKDAIREIVPGMKVNECEVEQIWDNASQKQWRRFIIDVDLPSERIVGIRLDKKYAIDGTHLTK